MSPRRALAAILVAVMLAGCAGSGALHKSFGDYNAALADINNRQLLMNLARMANIHPAHFLQIGLINSTFQFSTNAGTSFSETSTVGRSPVIGGVLSPLRLLSQLFTFGLTAGAAVSEQPTFAFTPLSGPQFARGFLGAVSPTVFFTMLEQGEPIDQLLRILVQSIEYTDETGKRVTLINLPVHRESFVQFLRVAGLAKELQQDNILGVRTVSSVVPVPGPVLVSPSVEVILKLAEKNLALQPVPNQPNQFTVVTTVSSPSLHVKPEILDAWRELGAFPYFQIVPPSRRGVAPKAPPAPGTIPPAPVMQDLTFKLRSFFELLSWIAVEQKTWDELAAQPGFLESLPPSQRQPVLRLTWEGVDPAQLDPPVVAATYLGKAYAIQDVKGTTWNRDVFTLLSYLYAQVSLDPKDLPVQQLIQVR
jgi:hypothetical protein